MAQKSDDNFSEPTHECYQIKKGQVFCIDLDIPKMKTKLSLKEFRQVPSNGEVSPAKITEKTSLEVTFRGSKELQGKNYRVKIYKLIGPIVPEKSSIAFENGKILVKLHKQENSSWYPQWEEGLEAATEDELKKLKMCDQSGDQG